MLNVYEQVDRNKRRSAFVIGLFAVFVTAFVYFIGRALGYGYGFVGFALIFSGLTSFFGYWYSDKIILAVSGARPASKTTDFKFFSAVENISLATGLPMPKLFVIDDSAPNAFATGRDPSHAVIAATTGLLNKLDKTEIESVVAHEMSHIKNYDMRLMSVVVVLVGMITLLADFLMRSSFSRKRSNDSGGSSGIFLIIGLVLALLSPLIGELIKLALSRRREFLADAGSVMITRQPSGLVSALKKISSDREPLEAANKATASLYIVNPLKGKDGKITWIANLFNTHPPVLERIKALEAME